MEGPSGADYQKEAVPIDVFDLFAKISLDTSDYEKELDNAGGKTSSFGEKLKSGLATAAKVGAAALTAATAATTAMTAALVKGVGDTAAYGDNIDKMSQKMGLSAEAYQEWDAIMQHSGTSIESLQAGMKTLANAVENGNDAFERLGISQEQIASMDNEELFSATISALQNVDNETERTYLAGQLLGRGATELGALLNTSAEETEAMRQRVHELGGVMSDDAVKASAAYQDSLQDMKTAFSGLARGMTGELLPSFTQVMDGITELFTGDSDKGLGMISEGMNSVLSSLDESIPAMIEKGSGIVNALIGGISEHLPDIANTAMQLLGTIANGITDNLPVLTNSAVEIIAMLASGIVGSLPEIASSAVEVITTLASGISDTIPELIPVAIDAILQLAETLTNPDSLGRMIDSAIELIMSLADGIVNAIPSLVAKAPIIISNLVTAISNNLPKIIQAGIDLIVKLGQGLIEAIPQLVSNIPTIISSIVGGFASYYSQIFDIGKNIVRGVWDGISGAASWLWGKVEGFFGGIVDGVLGFLGIHSPSRVFAGIGKNMALGLGEGWEDEYDSIKKSIEGDMDFGDASIGLGASGDTSGQSSGLFSGASRGDIIININGAKYSDERSLAIAISYELEKIRRQEVNAFG